MYDPFSLSNLSILNHINVEIYKELIIKTRDNE